MWLHHHVGGRGLKSLGVYSPRDKLWVSTFFLSLVFFVALLLFMHPLVAIRFSVPFQFVLYGCEFCWDTPGIWLCFFSVNVDR